MIDPEEIQRIADVAAEKLLADAKLAKVLRTETVISERKVTFLQYLNTAIISFIGVIAMITYVSTTNVRKSQSAAELELVRMKTIQDISTANISQMDKRLTSLELNYLDYIKTWVDENYIRKNIP